MRNPPSLSAELDRMIRRLGHSSAHIALLNVSAAGRPKTALLIAARAVANRSHVIGLLADGSVGIVSISGFSGDDESLEDQFVPRLRTILQVQGEELSYEPTTLTYRSVARPACELRDADDLMQILSDQPLRSVPSKRSAFPIYSVTPPSEARL